MRGGLPDQVEVREGIPQWVLVVRLLVAVGVVGAAQLQQMQQVEVAEVVAEEAGQQQQHSQMEGVVAVAEGAVAELQQRDWTELGEEEGLWVVLVCELEGRWRGWGRQVPIPKGVQGERAGG